MEELIQKTQEYLWYIKEHYANVQKAWKMIQGAGNGKGWSFLYDDWKWYTLDLMIKNHDMSKLAKDEFVPYRMKFYPTAEEKTIPPDLIKDAFGLAWERHLSCNDHHWQTWTKRGENEIGLEWHVIHNLVDWMAMAMKFNQPYMAYYEKNKDRIEMPDWAVELMYTVVAAIQEG